MKNYIICCFLLILSGTLAALPDTAALNPQVKFHHQVAFNATAFLKQFLSFNATNVNVTAGNYMLQYKFFTDKYGGGRVGFGGLYSGNKTKPQGHERSDSRYTIDAFVGYEYRFALGNKWVAWTGLDFITQVKNTYTHTFDPTIISATTIKEQTLSFGAGPLVGVQFNFNKRVSLYTETAFHYMNGKTKSSTTVSGFPDMNANEETNSNRLSFMLPTSIFLGIRF